ncbi:hypothetical protein Goklo_025427 [Gossypium klotzschianum]|uniref:Uncharacterized protein n=1 Tax=Gossypium klotzschianum TaxID=34286 RepID=A0A7J8W5X5_9ROSI|nr:hypothetical protein [Gossypium klotzschianum]
MFDDHGRWFEGTLIYEENENSTLSWDDYGPVTEQRYDPYYDWYTYLYLVASNKQEDETHLEEPNEDCKMPDVDETFEDRMSEYHVKPDTIDVEKKALNTMKVNSQDQVKIRKPSEDVYVTGKFITYNIQKFVSSDAEGFFHKLHGLSFIYECGFGPDVIFENEFWDIVDLYKLREFSLRPQRPTVPSVVHEFYANLKFFEEDKVYVRGREVEISPSVIFKYYRVHFLANNEIQLLETKNFKGANVDYIMIYLTEGRGEWERERRYGDFLSAFDHRSMSSRESTHRSTQTVSSTDYAYDNEFNLSEI